jgi:hypothetical protein
MNQLRVHQGNADITRYGNALLYFARVCDWDSFRASAATLFEYLETAVTTVLKQKIYRAGALMTIVLLAALVVSVLVGGGVLAVYQENILFIVAAGLVLELLVLAELRAYLGIRMSQEKRRKDQFIKKMERDFGVYAGPACTPG